MTNDLLFVYGTLRKNATIATENPFAKSLVHISNGYLIGRLFEISGYPGITLSGDNQDKVFGEIVRVINPEKTWPELDKYEESTDDFPEPHEYVRKKCPVYLPDGEPLFTWVYVFNRDTSGLTPIPSGDYQTFSC